MKSYLPADVNEFIDYCMDFYGPGGIYDDGRHEPMTWDEAYQGYLMRLVSRPDFPFDGDTCDREMVCQCVMELRDQQELTA